MEQLSEPPKWSNKHYGSMSLISETLVVVCNIGYRISYSGIVVYTSYGDWSISCGVVLEGTVTKLVQLVETEFATKNQNATRQLIEVSGC